MSVDVNNNFNSPEDKMQYALGTMNAYSVSVKCKSSGSGCSGIIALNHIDALIKVLSFYSKQDIDISPQDTLQIQATSCK